MVAHGPIAIAFAPMNSRVLIRRFAVLGMSFGLLACGGAPPASRSPSEPRDPPPAVVQTHESDAVLALDEIRHARVCIAPDVCEDLREWRPDALLVLDGHLAAIDKRHAFVWIEGAWVHYDVPVRDQGVTLTSNGHSAFFCASDGSIVELTSEGVQLRGMKSPTHECAVVLSAGQQLYVIAGDGPVLRQEANEWAALAFELLYGDGYGTGTAAMSGARAFVLDEQCQLLELPPTGPSYEPRVIVDPQVGEGVCEVRPVPGTERLLVSGRAQLAVIEGSTVRGVRWPAGTGQDGEDEDGEASEDPDASPSSEGETLPLGRDFVGLDPLILAASSATVVSRHEGRVTVGYYVLRGDAWAPLASAPESFPAAFGIHAFETTMPKRSFPVAIGESRLVLNTYEREVRGPAVTISARTGADVHATAFPVPERPSQGVDSTAPCGATTEGCGRTRSGMWHMLTLLPTGYAVELFGNDGARVARHVGSGLLAAAVDGSPQSLFIVEQGRNNSPQRAGYVDATGFHAIVLPPRARVSAVVATPQGNAYFVTEDAAFYFDGARVRRVQGPPSLITNHWVPVGEGFVIGLPDVGPVYLHAGTAEALDLGQDVGGIRSVEVTQLSGSNLAQVTVPTGTTWLVSEGSDVLEVTAPTLPAPFAGTCRYLRERDNAWVLTCDGRSARFRTTAAPLTRSLGTLASHLRPGGWARPGR